MIETKGKKEKRRFDPKTKGRWRTIKLIKEAKARRNLRAPNKRGERLDHQTFFKPNPIPWSKEVTAKIKEIKDWIEELKKLEVSENTDINKEEIVLLLRTMFRELKLKTEQDEALRNLESEFQRIIKLKRNKVAELKKPNRQEQKQLNRELDLKHFEGSLADKLEDLIVERNVKMVRVVLDRLWRKAMNGDIFDSKAIEAAQKFLREADSNSS